MTTKMCYADKLKIDIEKQKDKKIEKINETLFDKYNYLKGRILNDIYIDNIEKYLIGFYVDNIISDIKKITKTLSFRTDITDYLCSKYVEGNKFMKQAVKHVFENY